MATLHKQLKGENYRQGSLVLLSAFAVFIVKHFSHTSTKRGAVHYRLLTYITVFVLVACLGTYFIFTIHAATGVTSQEAEAGVITGAAITKADASASGGSYVQFGGNGSSGNFLCGWMTGAPRISKVLIIWEENDSYSNIIGNSADPYINSVVSHCVLATNYYAYAHPSLPNYMAVTSGVSYASSPWNNDCSPGDSGCATSNASIFSQLGSDWKSFAESMPGSCYKTNSGEYAVRHNPATYYTNINSACNSQDLPLGSSTSGNFLTAIQNGLPAFSSVTPNLIDDMHDGTLQDADNWLSTWIPIITNGSDYQTGQLAILIAWDEGSGSGNSQSQTAVLGLSPYSKPDTKDGTSYNDFSIMKTIDNLTGQTPLGQSSSATSMTQGFGF